MRLPLAAALGTAFIASAASAQHGGALHCGGTEPFWSVTITARAMWYSTPDIQRLELVPVQPSRAAGRPQDLVRVYQTKRADGRGGPITLVVTRNAQTCSDGMSDRRYPYNAVYIGDGVLEGCCRWAQ